HHAQPQGRADRRRARPDPDRRRGARREGRLDHGARRREEGAAEGSAEARQVPPRAGRGREWRRRGQGRRRVMDLKVTTLDGKAAGSVSLNKDIFGLEPRKDLIQRCINWQLAKRQAGTHAVKNRADISLTGKKSGPQKGSGGARHGSQRANLFRGGGRAFGPVVRSHAHDLPKKVRALALRHALSAKAKDGGIGVVDTLNAKE